MKTVDAAAEPNASCGLRTARGRLQPSAPRCPSEFVSWATHLLNQQLWCFGRDIKYPGNLLVAHGFERIPPPEGKTCSSVYRLNLPMVGRLMLRGFGAFYGEDGVGGVFLSRGDFGPLLTPGADLRCLPWLPESLPPMRAPTKDELAHWRYLTGVLVGWLRLYERWVWVEAGPEHREDAVDRWAQRGRPVVAAGEMSVAWGRVEEWIQGRPETSLHGRVHAD